MARQARIVIPEAAHHVVARGVNGARLFRNGWDKGRRYLRRFAVLAEEHEVVVFAYCLMDNHVHFLLVPKRHQSLAKLFQRLHTWWAGYYNRLKRRTGPLFEGRFYSTPVDEAHFWAAMRYIELNPQRAGLATKAFQIQYSSLKAHLTNKPDSFVCLNLDPIKHRRWTGKHWQEFLEEADWERDKRLLRHLARF